MDPFLIYQSNHEPWLNSHELLTNHFNDAIKLVAQSRFDKTSIAWRKAKRLLTFPEPDEELKVAVDDLKSTLDTFE